MMHILVGHGSDQRLEELWKQQSRNIVVKVGEVGDCGVLDTKAKEILGPSSVYEVKGMVT
jgi:hypothetical protein